MSDFKARIKPLSKEEAIKRAIENDIPQQVGELNIFRVLLNHPVLAKEINSSLMMLLFNGNKLDHRLRELIIMRLGWATGSDYEWTQHWTIALQFGLNEEEVLAVKDWENSKVLNDIDKAVLAATDDTLNHGFVTKETWGKLEKTLESDQERLEVIASIGSWRMISQILQSLEIPLDDGLNSWPPDGIGPK